MNRILASALINIVLIATALASSATLAEDTLRVSLENGKQRVDFSLNGRDKCVMIDEKIVCAPIPRETVRVATADSN